MNNTLFFEVGAFTDFILYTRVKGISRSLLVYDTPPYQEVVETEVSEKTVLNAYNVGVLFGVGFLLPVNTYRILVKPEYKFGILDLNSSSQTPINSRYLKLSIGIKF